MSNPFYNPSGNPATGSEGLSALMRAEFVAVSNGFDLLPRFTTTGLFDTIFDQQGSYTFTLPSHAGTLALTTDIAANVTAEAVARTAADAAETARATAAEALRQPILGYTPVQQGTGVGQLGNPVKIGWTGTALALTIDNADQGPFAMGNDVTARLALKQDALGYTPVQQGTGIGQHANVVKIGFGDLGKLKLTIDATDLGNFAMESWVTARLALLPFVTPWDYGALGNGALNPLSGVTTVTVFGAAISTVGYTLTQWQTLYPSATSLAESLDRIALQTAINAGVGKKPVIVPAAITTLLDKRITVPGNSNIRIDGRLNLANQVNTHCVMILAGAGSVTIDGNGTIFGNKTNQTANNDPANFGNGGIVTELSAYPLITSQDITISGLTITDVLEWPISLNNATRCVIRNTRLLNSGNAPQFCNGTSYSTASGNIIENIPDYAFATYEGCTYCNIVDNIATNAGPFGCLNDGAATGWNNTPQHDIVVANNISSNPQGTSGVTIATIVTGAPAVMLYDISVKGNVILNAVGSGITLSGCRDSVIEGNIITGGLPAPATTHFDGIQGIGFNLLIKGNRIANGESAYVAGSVYGINLSNLDSVCCSDNYVVDYGGEAYVFGGTMPNNAILRGNMAGAGPGVFAPGCVLIGSTAFMGPTGANDKTTTFNGDLIANTAIIAHGSISALGSVNLVGGANSVLLTSAGGDIVASPTSGSGGVRFTPQLAGTLPASGVVPAGTQRFVSNARNASELTGAGTGAMATMSTAGVWLANGQPIIT